MNLIRNTTSRLAPIIALIYLCALSAYAAPFTSTVFSTVVPQPNGIAATPYLLLVTSSLNTNTIYSLDGNGGLLGISTIPVASTVLDQEMYLAAAPGVGGGWTANDIYAVRGSDVWKVGAGSTLLSTPTLLTTIPCPNQAAHSGITFDQVGTFKFDMIITCETGQIITVDNSFRPPIVSTLTQLPSVDITEGPVVTPPSFSGVPSPGTPLGSVLFVAQDNENEVEYINRGRISAVFTTTIRNPEGVMLVPQSICTFGNGAKAGAFFSVRYKQADSSGVIEEYPAGDFAGIGGNLLVPIESPSNPPDMPIGNIKMINGPIGFASGAITDFDNTDLFGWSREGSTFVECISSPTVASTTPPNNATGVFTGSKLTAMFSEAMDPSTITTATFTVTGNGGTPVSGTVSYINTTATFTPANDLAPNTLFTATIASAAKDLSGYGLASNYVWSFTTGSSSAATLPTVIDTVPANRATDVPINSKLTATFSSPMDPLTINTATFTVQQGTSPVSGTVAYFAGTAIFTPGNNLPINALLTATITTAAKDLTGNALGSNYVWTFTTGSTADLTPPTVSFTSPANSATGVSINSRLFATFSKPMDPSTITSATLAVQQGASSVSGTVAYFGGTVTFTPGSNFQTSTTVTATITTAAKDLEGNALASNYVWSFATGSSADNTPPTVSNTLPANGATGVFISTKLTAIFSKPMDPVTINTASFKVAAASGAFISGNVSFAGATAVFTPTSNLPANTVVSATITTGARDLGGNPLANNFVWSFTTGSTGGQAPVNLGSAASFAVLAGTAVTNVGPNNVNGDLGVSPGTVVTGFPPGTVTGTVHAGDPVAARAQVDLTTAYNDAAGRSGGSFPVSGNLGGQTFVPGLYKSVASLEISTGDVTLDAKGDASAVFIFQITSTFTTAAGRNIILTGGAKASNVIWQVGGTATLGTNSVFKGNILGNQSIVVNSGTALEGRLLARNGAVSFLGSEAPFINQGGTVNAASYTHTVAAGSIAAVFGTNLAIGQGFASDIPLPTTLARSSFQIGDLGAPLFYASPSQVNVQIPWELAGQTQASITAVVDGVGSNRQTVNIAPYAPGIFTVNQAGTGQGAILINSTGQLAAPQDVLGGQPAHPGEFISIYCTGLGPVSNQPPTGTAASSSLSFTSSVPTVSIGGLGAQVSYSGLAPNFVGLYQVNAQVPDVPAGDAVEVTLSIGGVTSNPVTIRVQ